LHNNQLYFFSKDISYFIPSVRALNQYNFKQKINYNKRIVHYNPERYVNCDFTKISKCSSHYHSVNLLSEIVNFTIYLGATFTQHIISDTRDVYILDEIFYRFDDLENLGYEQIERFKSFFLNTAVQQTSGQLVVLYCERYDLHKPSYWLWTKQFDKFIWILLLISLTLPAVFQKNIFIFITKFITSFQFL
jgi:hypothetical protein